MTDKEDINATDIEAKSKIFVMYLRSPAKSHENRYQSLSKKCRFIDVMHQIVGPKWRWELPDHRVSHFLAGPVTMSLIFNRE